MRGIGMAKNMVAERLRSNRCPWSKNMQCFSRRLLCCLSLRAEEEEPLPGQDKRRDRDPQSSCQDEGASGEREAIHITVEDLGLVNPSFSLTEEEEEAPAQRCTMGRSVSLVAACLTALKKTKLQPLSSLPLQPRADWGSSLTSEEEEEEEVDPLLFDSGTSTTPASGSLFTPPVINLIPPTPSDVIDDDQFFDINSEEGSVAHTLGSDDSYATGDQERDEERVDNLEQEQSKKDMAMDKAMDDSEGVGLAAESQEEVSVAEEREKERPKPSFLRSAYQVAPLPEYPWKRTYNTGINLLLFTEHNLDDLSNKDVSCHELLKAQVHLLPLSTKMDTFTHLRKPAARSCSLGDTVTRSHTFHAISQAPEHVQEEEEERSPRQRRITVASYMPQSKDQNGNIAEKELDRQEAKSLGELDTDEVCQWFSGIGLQKCLPFIREADLCGADIASVDVNTLDILHIFSLEEREHLLSAIYRELHPPSTTSQRLDSLLEIFGPNNVERFTAALVSMTKSKSSPHVSCLNMNQCSFKLRCKSQNAMVQRNFQLMEITINASEQIVHLRTPKDTTVGKVMESCLRMLGMSKDKDLFSLSDKKGSSDVLSPEQHIGGLPTSNDRQLELHLCKKEKPKGVDNQYLKVNGSHENGTVNQNLQVSLPGKEEKIRELNQQVDSLQNVILQVQELHHGLVAFCSELKSMDGEVDASGLGSAELEQRLGLAQERLRDKRQSLQALKDNMSNAAAHRSKRPEVRLLDKMKLNCKVFKEEIFLVHLNRQVAHLETTLQDCQDKEKAQRKCTTLGQLVSPQCPAMLLVVQESRGADGRYGFTCCLMEGRGLVVVQVDNSHLCLNDRLVEMDGLPVVGYSEEELSTLLLQRPSAQIVVLRRPPPSTPYSQQPPSLDHPINPEPNHTTILGSEDVTTATPQHHELIAI